MKASSTNFLPSLSRNGGGGDENISRFRAGVLVVVRLRLELHGGVHFRAQVGIGFQNLNLDLDRRFLPVRFRRHFGDLAFVGAIFEGVEGDDAFLLRRELGKVVLRDIEFDLNVVQIGEGDDRSARAAFGAAGKLRGDQFALFGGALQNRAGDGSANHSGIELRLGVGHLAFGLQQVAFGALDFFGARAELHQLESDCSSEFMRCCEASYLAVASSRFCLEATPCANRSRVRSRLILSLTAVARASERL